MDCAPPPKDKSKQEDEGITGDASYQQDTNATTANANANTNANAGAGDGNANNGSAASPAGDASTTGFDEEAQAEEEGEEGNAWWARGGLFKLSNEAMHREELRHFVDKFKKYVPRDEEENTTAEKLTFIFSCLQVVFMGMIATSDSMVPLTPYFHIVTYPVLFLIRFFQYRSRGHHYFVLDFCYWFNLLLILYFVAFPESASLFAVIFALSHGPVAWTILLYRNSLVFHSIDRFTSFYIHFAPLVICYSLRWNPINASKYWYTTFGVEMVPSDVSFLEDTKSSEEWLAISGFMVICSIIAYEAWQAAYGFIIGVIAKYCANFFSVYHDKSRLTLYRHTKQSQKGWLYKLLMVGNGRCPIAIWVLLNMMFTLLCCLPTYIWYEYQGAGAAFVILVYVVACNNGAGFYLKAWAKIQMRRRERLQQQKTNTALATKSPTAPPATAAKNN